MGKQWKKENLGLQPFTTLTASAWQRPDTSLWEPPGPCCMHTKSLQSCLTLWDSMGCSLPGTSVHGILQTRMLGRVAIPLSRFRKEEFFFLWAQGGTELQFLGPAGEGNIMIHESFYCQWPVSLGILHVEGLGCPVETKYSGDWNCLSKQSRNRDSDVENKCYGQQGGKGSGMNWEIGIDIYICICIK